MMKDAQEIVDGLDEATLKEVFHLAGKKLGRHGGVTAQDDSGNTPTPPPPPPKPHL